MADTRTVAIISDIHYAGPNERSRGHEILQGVQSRAVLLFLKFYRHYIWCRDPFAHNHLLARFISECAGADLTVANGDYACNVAYLGLRDEGTFQSAAECLGQLRTAFPRSFLATLGDHELGKKKMGGDEGGLQLESWDRAQRDLQLEPIWTMDLGCYLLIGITSTVVAMPIYESEAASGDRPQWNALHQQHLEKIGRIFNGLKPDQKVILFCHDPTALPFLYRFEPVHSKLDRIERTIIGHLHSNLLVRQSRFLSRMPQLSFGHTSRRISSALRQARLWKHFNILLCPAPFGIELLKDGGYYTADLDLRARRPAQFHFHPFQY